MKKQKKTASYAVPIIVIPDTILFPKMVHPIFVKDSDHFNDLLNSLKSLEEKDRIIGLLRPVDDNIEEYFEVGVTAKILESKKINDQVKLTVQGLGRFKYNSIVGRKIKYANVVPLESKNVWSSQTKALLLTAVRLYKELVSINPSIPKEFSNMIDAVKNPGQIADMMASSIPIVNDEKQEFLDILDVGKRLIKLIEVISVKKEEFRISNEIIKKAKEAMNETQKKFFLRQQIKAIKEELEEGDDDPSEEIAEYEERINEKDLPEEVEKEARRELKRLKRSHAGSAERSVITTYLDWILDLPWNEFSEDTVDINEAQEILDGDHYGLEKAKKRIIEYLAIRKLKDDPQGPILCFVGPPGTGKTSMGKSIAKALGRKFIRISLGGVRDEAEIRGHRRTYVGALPGRIIQGIKRVGTSNPVFMLDEIDKLGKDFRGDPSSALLEALDPEQNHSFSDHYMGVKYDLSKIMFITTANISDPIPPALQDRLEMIKFPGYTPYEKLNIAKQFLIKKQREAHGLKARQIKFTDASINKIIYDYTYEAGVRNLEREIANVARGVTAEIVKNELTKASITIKNLCDYLGKEKVPPPNKVRDMTPGMVPVLLVNDHGGHVSFIEARKFKREVTSDSADVHSIILTGRLGEVLRESATIALSYLCTVADEVGILNFVEENVIHIHIPAGSVLKEGPSAGVALFIVLASLFTNTSARKDVTMTGEITLTGDVLPIGGTKEKVLAAHRAGMKTVILPKWNERDLEDVADEIKDELEFKFISNVMEALDIAVLDPDLS